MPPRRPLQPTKSDKPCPQRSSYPRFGGEEQGRLWAALKVSGWPGPLELRLGNGPLGERRGDCYNCLPGHLRPQPTVKIAANAAPEVMPPGMLSVARRRARAGPFGARWHNLVDLLGVGDFGHEAGGGALRGVGQGRQSAPTLRRTASRQSRGMGLGRQLRAVRFGAGPGTGARHRGNAASCGLK